MRSFFVVAEVHQNKSCRIPNLIGKVTARLNSLVGETHIVSGAVARCKCKSQSVRSVFVDYLKRVNAVAERL